MASRAKITVTQEELRDRIAKKIAKGVEEQPEYGKISANDQVSEIFPEASLVTIQAVKEYLALLWAQYQGASKELKGRILDELTRNLGIHRKAAIRALNGRKPPRIDQGRRGGGPRPYSESAKKWIVQLWRDMGYMGALRMKAAIPEWLDCYSREEISESVRQELRRMGARTIERFLTPAKAELRRQRNTGTTRGVRKLVTEIPIRDLNFVPDEPGHCEIDTVAHCGASMSGTFAWTLTLTDILTGWTETFAIWGKDGSGVRAALDELSERLPFKLAVLYIDNGSEFINEEVIDGFAKSTGVRVYRSRPYRKNDQCYVEQKNFTHVRQLMGYGRIDWKPAVAMMNNVYRTHWRMVQNFYCPQQKLQEKVRIGSRIIRRMDEPKTPYRRLAPFLRSNELIALKRIKDAVNPKESMRKLRKATRNILSYFKDSIPKREWGKVPA